MINAPHLASVGTVVSGRESILIWTGITLKLQSHHCPSIDGATHCSTRTPYTKWDWKSLGVRLGGPDLIQLLNGRFVAVVRLYDKSVCTSLCWLDPENGRLTEALKLPSGGDTSYAGLVTHDDLLWISYYSSHEGKTSIYLAKVRFEN